MPYTIAAFSDAHLPELVDLWVAAWTKAMPMIDFEQRRAWLVPRLRALQDAGANIVCLVDEEGDMAGFATLDLATAEIDQLAVAPMHWGNGAAGTLIDEMKRRALRHLRLDVNQDNPRAVRFYEKHGFHRTAEGINPSSGLTTWRYEWTR